MTSKNKPAAQLKPFKQMPDSSGKWEGFIPVFKILKNYALVLIIGSFAAIIICHFVAVMGHDNVLYFFIPNPSALSCCKTPSEPWCPILHKDIKDII